MLIYYYAHSKDVLQSNPTNEQRARGPGVATVKKTFILAFILAAAQGAAGLGLFNVAASTADTIGNRAAVIDAAVK